MDKLLIEKLTQIDKELNQTTHLKNAYGKKYYQKIFLKDLFFEILNENIESGTINGNLPEVKSLLKTNKSGQELVQKINLTVQSLNQKADEELASINQPFQTEINGTIKANKKLTAVDLKVSANTINRIKKDCTLSVKEKKQAIQPSLTSWEIALNSDNESNSNQGEQM